MNDIIVRVAKTFIQAAGGCLVAAIAEGIDITNKPEVLGIIASASAAGIAAVWNLLLAMYNAGKEGSK